MLNFLKKKHEHNFEEVMWYATRYDCGYFVYVYRTKVCSCGKVKGQRCIYSRKFGYSGDQKNQVEWWVSKGALTEEEFAFKYR